MLIRKLEMEVMDSAAVTAEYDAMDHSVVNAAFVADFLAVEPSLDHVLDLGTGTAQIPIELCRRALEAQITAVDAAASMLDLARRNVERAGVASRLSLALVDAKRLPYADGGFSAVISNSIVHHIPEPLDVLREAVRVCVVGGVIFFRDLLRPANHGEIDQLVALYAGNENSTQRQLFADSLHAALTVDEVRKLVSSLGCSPSCVKATSDRHWTWCEIIRH